MRVRGRKVQKEWLVAFIVYKFRTFSGHLNCISLIAVIFHSLDNELCIQVPVGKLDFFTMSKNFVFAPILLQRRFDLLSFDA